MEDNMKIKRGDVYYADLGPTIGSELGGLRPVLIFQPDVGNKYSPTVVAIPMKRKTDETTSSPHVLLPAEICGLAKDSLVMIEETRTIDKHRLKEKMGHLDKDIMEQIAEALKESFELKPLDL